MIENHVISIGRCATGLGALFVALIAASCGAVATADGEPAAVEDDEERTLCIPLL
jgi:hypothetical protein